MTDSGTGMTERGTGMTDASRSMTECGTGMTDKNDYELVLYFNLTINLLLYYLLMLICKNLKPP